MYYLINNLHNLFFWVIAIAVVFTLYRSIGGMRGALAWEKTDETWGKIVFHSINLQFILGLILYIFLSPSTQAAFDNFGAAMELTSLRFWAVEHITLMLVAIALFHIGTSKVKKAYSDREKFKKRLIFYLLGTVVILLAIPWPFREEIGRNLFPFF